MEELWDDGSGERRNHMALFCLEFSVLNPRVGRSAAEFLPYSRKNERRPTAEVAFPRSLHIWGGADDTSGLHYRRLENAPLSFLLSAEEDGKQPQNLSRGCVPSFVVFGEGRFHPSLLFFFFVVI